MRRIDILLIGLGVFGGGGLVYWLLQNTGLDSLDAGIWSQAALIGVVLIWVGSYVFRVLTKQMTLGDQLRDYEEAVMRKRLEEMTPEELAALQAEVEAERQAQAGSSPGQD